MVTKKVIVAIATDSTANALYEYANFINDNTHMRAYPSVDNEAVFFPVDRYDLKWLKSVLLEKGYNIKIKDALD